MKFGMCIDYTRKISKFPPWGRGEKEGERFPIFYIISIFLAFSPLGRMAEMAEHPTYVQKVPGSNPIRGQFFLFFFWFDKLSFACFIIFSLIVLKVL